MKKSIAGAVAAVSVLLFTITTHSQNTSVQYKTTIVPSYPLSLAYNKTTNLVFPYAIKSVDRGSRDVLAQKAKGVENILLVKAGRENFAETNLSVITTDGKLYSFLLNYSVNPVLLTISFAKDTAVDGRYTSQSGSNEAEMEFTAEKISREKRMLHGIKHKKFEMRLRLNGLYIKSDVLYFQLEVRNNSNLTYDVDMLRLFIRDQKKAERTASQEIELLPLYAYGDTSSVKPQSTSVVVFAFPKFTIPDKKYLLIQLMEKDGGRHLHLDVGNRMIVKAKPSE
ncbi:conjugative transposon protein TraN [Paracnuella aquatica]|uniref:conjugative transposon protein TraN n=1 Tax=Paracnuella aquatica TaxID=2268757 RepID=UPI000DF003E4|nr:conjugative transposon protein TraN [Paracnuella aquatica]RPD44054.1 conjugative transposon protein TraN [Paracnuella aquatica]